MTVVKKIIDFSAVRPSKFFKDTLFQGKHLMLGINCFEPEQEQHVHDHPDQDKFYYVVSGEGVFTVGEDKMTVGEGHVVFAAAGVPHGVVNKSNDSLVIFMGIAPPPAPR